MSTLTVVFGVTGGAHQTKPANPGSTIPFRIQLVDVLGNNLADNSLVVTAYGVQMTGSTTWLPAPSANGSDHQS